MTAAMLRLDAGRDPLNEDLTALIGSCPPAARTSGRDGPSTTSTSTAPAEGLPPPRGGSDVSFDVFEMPGEPGLSIVTYSAEPGTSAQTGSHSWPAGRRTDQHCLSCGSRHARYAFSRAGRGRKLLG